MSRRHVLIPFLVAAALATAVTAADWPQWRGPKRDGVAAGVALPSKWPEKLTRRWSVVVGEGHATPVLSGDRVLLHSREGDNEAARALKLSDGSTVWTRTWPIPYQMHPAATGHGKGPKSSPALIGGTFYTLSINGTMNAINPGNGEIKWTREMSSRYKATSPLFGVAASPAVDGGLIVAPFGGHHAGTLAALDVRTGEQKWGLEGDGPGYASPIIAEIAGVKQVITQTDQRVIGVEAATGKLLWSVPITTPYDQNSVTPVIAGKLVLISGLEYGLRAFSIERAGEAMSAKEVWTSKEASLYMSSPVLAGGRVFSFTHNKKGQLVCVDPKTGATIWAGPESLGDYAALVAAGPVVLALTEGADLIVMAADTPAYTELARYKVADSQTWAHPVPTANGVLIKDKTNLTLWTW